MNHIMFLCLVFFIPMILFFLVFLALFITEAVGIYNIAKKRGIPGPWMAFIPIASTYLFGKLASPVKFGKKRNENCGLWLMLGEIIILILSAAVTFISIGIVISSFADLSADISAAAFMPQIAALMVFVLLLCLAALAYTAFYAYIAYNLFSCLCPKNALLFAIVGILCNVTMPFFIIYASKFDYIQPETISE